MAKGSKNRLTGFLQISKKWSVIERNFELQEGLD